MFELRRLQNEFEPRGRTLEFLDSIYYVFTSNASEQTNIKHFQTTGITFKVKVNRPLS